MTDENHDIGLSDYASQKKQKKQKMRTLVCCRCSKSFTLPILRGPVRQYCDFCRLERNRELHGSIRRLKRISLLKSELAPLVRELIAEALAEAGLVPAPSEGQPSCSAPNLRLIDFQKARGK